MTPPPDPEPRHEQLRRAVLATGDAELDQWTNDPEDYVLVPASIDEVGSWSFFELLPTGASRPVSVLLAVSGEEVLVASGNAEAVARVAASARGLDDESLAELVFELWRPRGRAMARVPGTGQTWRDVAGWHLLFDIDDAWNGRETWTVLLEPGRARVDAWGSA